MSDQEWEGMSGADPVGIETDDEPSLGAAVAQGKKRLADSRFDPAVLFSEIKAEDWRIDASTNAEGVNHPAVQAGGVILFFEPVPTLGHSNFAGDVSGGKAPWAFRAVRMGIELLCPPTPTMYHLNATPPATEGVDHRFPSHSQMLAEIIGRGLFTMDMGEVNIFKNIPVSLIGAAGGMQHDGDGFGSGQNMQPAWSNSFKMPDELILTPESGSALKAQITLNKADLAALSTGDTGTGWGCPFEKQPRIATAGAEATTLTNSLALYLGVRLSFWGQRGINIRVGRASIVKSVAEQR